MSKKGKGRLRLVEIHTDPPVPDKRVLVTSMIEVPCKRCGGKMVVVIEADKGYKWECEVCG